MCVIGIKYQFITLHNNTNIPCRLKKKKKKKRRGDFFKMSQSNTATDGALEWEKLQAFPSRSKKKCPLLLSDKSHSSEHENRTAQKKATHQ